MSTALEEHDRLLAQKPQDAQHLASECPFCRDDSESASLAGGTVAEKTYTEEEYNALSSEVSELQAKVAELTAAAGNAEVEAAVTAAKAELETQVADLQSQLDTAVAEAEIAKQNQTDLVAYLEAEVQAQQEIAAREERKTARVAAVEELGSFPAEHIAAHADRWADMSEESFTASYEDWKAIAEAAKQQMTATNEQADEEIPDTTAMTAAVRSNNNNNDKSAAVREVFGLRLAGADVRSI